MTKSRVYLVGADSWRFYDRWPPSAEMTKFFLQPDNVLSTSPASYGVPPDHYDYDPKDPTPAVGGALFFSGAGPRDNRALESRKDVLTYTSSPLAHNLDVIGHVSCTLHVSSSREHTDFFARLCDVHPDGRSMNVCDGIIRLYPGKVEPDSSGSLCIEVDMWATAYRFRRGHAIRLQVSSGAHPRFAPNSGTGEVPRSPENMCVAHQTVFHDASRPSAIILPLV
ncbi:MAG TPA: CocE/NonD family hydrolase [Candidatus Sulfomarinibacteraceae bacterium]|nr:CocE/NonD family hydrolase [Candidatus Sulfomarinibacteraceae bacterium]